MYHRRIGGALVLSVSPSSRGVGFAVFEGPHRLVDWGMKEARKEKNRTCLRKIKQLVEFYEPDVVVVEDCRGEDSRRSKRVRRLITDVVEMASGREIVVRGYSRPVIQQFFSQHAATTKHEISRVIAAQLPELEPRLPPFRKPWMSEDSRMSMFDAVAIAMTFFDFERLDRKAA